MIRHKATGTELAWRPTRDNYGDQGAQALASGDEIAVAFFYSPELGWLSTVYTTEPRREQVFAGLVETRDDLLAKAVELGVVEIISDGPVTADSADDTLLEDVRSLAVRLFLAGHDDAACELRRLL